MKYIKILIASAVITATLLILGSTIEKNYLIKHIQIVGIGPNYVDINWGHEELNDGHFSDDNIHRYTFNN